MILLSICIARRRLSGIRGTGVPDIHANLISPHSDVDGGIFHSDGGGDASLGDGLADNVVEEGGLADLAIADEDDWMGGGVPLKHKFWELVVIE